MGRTPSAGATTAPAPPPSTPLPPCVHRSTIHAPLRPQPTRLEEFGSGAKSSEGAVLTCVPGFVARRGFDSGLAAEEVHANSRGGLSLFSGSTGAPFRLATSRPDARPARASASLRVVSPPVGLPPLPLHHQLGPPVGPGRLNRVVRGTWVARVSPRFLLALASRTRRVLLPLSTA